ncbi:hypothetical protein SUGI_0028000 [Cryptomeria japonica]|nr:hypothetical protein SUGI_0028000 [Cryptomeria japonica]
MADRSAGCLKKGERKRVPWTFYEDIRLISYITLNGDGRWDILAKASGLKRCGRSCRLRWVNYLSPDLNHANMTPQEERLIVDLHSRWGNRWSLIAQSLPGTTDNRIKNYWKTRFRKKFQLQENGESSVHCASSTRSPSLPNSSQKAKEPSMIHITEAQHTAISPFH